MGLWDGFFEIEGEMGLWETPVFEIEGEMAREARGWEPEARERKARSDGGERERERGKEIINNGNDIVFISR